jgi:hypothetical protein
MPSTKMSVPSELLSLKLTVESDRRREAMTDWRRVLRACERTLMILETTDRDRTAILELRDRARAEIAKQERRFS